MGRDHISESTKRALIQDDRPADERDVRAATAPYQADFPYERDDEAQVTRREFCNFLGLRRLPSFSERVALPQKRRSMDGQASPVSRPAWKERRRWRPIVL